MEELIARMNRILADTYQIYLKTHFYHWNITGPDFPQYHEFLNEIYDEVYGSVDPIAEHIRQLDGIPQNAPSMIKQNSSIVETTSVKPALDMLEDINFDMQTIVKNITETAKLADKFSELGLSNFLQDRHAAYKKHIWMLKSTGKP